MPIIKRQSVNGTELQLHRQRSSRRGYEYEYYVTERGGSRIDDPVYTRQNGVAQFDNTVRAYRRADEEDSRGPSVMGMGMDFGSTSRGGDSPTLPDFGFDERSSQKGPTIPGMDSDHGKSKDDDDDDEWPFPF